MPIRWSTLKVSEAADKIEEHFNQAVKTLERAREVAREARTIANLPGYIDQDFTRIIGEIEDCLGGTQFRPVGWFKATVERIRKDLPEGSVKDERESAQHGTTQSLI